MGHMNFSNHEQVNQNSIFHAKSAPNQRNRRQINKNLMKSTPNHKKINEINAKSAKKSMRSTPNQQEINEIHAKSTKNQ
jgi:hypothetical protein